MHNQVRATVRTAFPKTTSVAKTLKVSDARTAKITSLMDKIAAWGSPYHITAFKKSKAKVAKKKSKK